MARAALQMRRRAVALLPLALALLCALLLPATAHPMRPDCAPDGCVAAAAPLLAVLLTLLVLEADVMLHSLRCFP